MPLFGAHMSITGGLHKALESAKALGMDTVQLFTASPSKWQVSEITPPSAGKTVSKSGKVLTKNGNQWNARDLTDDEVTTFRDTLRQTKIRYATAHDSYLINMASPEEKLYKRSVEAFVVELQRAERLGLSYLVTHPGAHLDSGEDAGLQKIAKAIDEVHARCPNFNVRILLETTAGQGTTLGYRFEHLARILSLVADPDRLGTCLDTCHVFAAGYELAPAAEYEKTIRAFQKTVGLKKLLAFHINDSVKGLGSRVDRHAHIGKGELGLEPFRLLVNDKRFRNRPMVLETPKEEGDADDMDTVNLATLRRLLQADSSSKGAK
jgi:deoxyribonuclease-4